MTRSRRNNGMRRPKNPPQGRVNSHGQNREGGYVSGIPRVRTQDLHTAIPFKLTTAATGAISSVIFRANGAWDPEYAAGGVTPFNWPFWQKQYNHYIVLKSRITATVSSCDAKTGANLGIYVADDNSVPYGTAQEMIAARRGTYTLIPANVLANPPKAYAKFDAKVFYNVKDPQDVTMLRAKTDNLPTEQALFWVWAGGVSEGTINGMVEIRYTVLFQEPKDVEGQSASTTNPQVNYPWKRTPMITIKEDGNGKETTQDDTVFQAHQQSESKPP